MHGEAGDFPAGVDLGTGFDKTDEEFFAVGTRGETEKLDTFYDLVKPTKAELATKKAAEEAGLVEGVKKLVARSSGESAALKVVEAPPSEPVNEVAGLPFVDEVGRMRGKGHTSEAGEGAKSPELQAVLNRIGQLESELVGLRMEAVEIQKRGPVTEVPLDKAVGE